MTETLTCIRCSRPLVAFPVEGQSVLACLEHGMWMQREQLVAITDDLQDDVAPIAEDAAWSTSNDAPAGMVEERFHTCPVCEHTLRKDNWRYGSGIVVDVCDEHGIWVDRGEIAQIEAWEEAWAAHAG